MLPRNYMKCGTAALALMAFSIPAYAQNEGGAALEDIVVTAQKRSENLQDVPIAVAAITSTALEQQRVQTSQDLQFQVPSLVYTDTGGYAQPFLRGIGSDFTQPNADASVATYVDGAFVSNVSSTITNMLGVDRVEVLLGPQGTLYGRNAVGGAINIITLTPTQDLRTKATLTFGNYDRKEATMQVSGGITDNLAVGIYAAGSIRNSYLKMTLASPAAQRNPDDESAWGVRFKAVWTPTDTITLTGSLERTKVSSVESSAIQPVDANGLAFVAFGAPPIIGKYQLANDGPGFLRSTITNATLREEVDLGFANIVGITNYRDADIFNSNDIDGSTAYVLTSDGFQPNNRQFSQELQLLSPTGSSWDWIVGLYYFNEKGGFNPTRSLSPVLFAAPVQGVGNFGLFKTRSYAAFAQATVPITDQFRVTLGARYTIDKKRYNGSIGYFDANGVEILPRDIFSEKRKTWKKFTPKITLDYRIDDTLLYATFSKGFKSGAFNTTSPADPGPVDPENLTAYEIGSKSDLLDGRVRFNTSAYYYKFNNIQVQIVNFSAGGATGTTSLQNAAKAEAYGVEANLDLAVTSDLRASAALAWAHSKYVNFPNFAGVQPGAVGNDLDVVDVSGNRLTRSPKWVLTAGLDYSHELSSGGKINGNINWYYNDGFFWTAQNTLRQKSYHLVNASVGYTFPGDRLGLSVWVTNLTDQYYRRTILPISVFGTFGQDSAPRMWGGTLTFKFN